MPVNVSATTTHVFVELALVGLRDGVFIRYDIEAAYCCGVSLPSELNSGLFKALPPIQAAPFPRQEVDRYGKWERNTGHFQ